MSSSAHLQGDRVRIRIPYDREYPFGREILGVVCKHARRSGVIVIADGRQFVVPAERVTREVPS